jgi:succinate dehydrogenase/fumarate reductase cytochrome b subunit
MNTARPLHRLAAFSLALFMTLGMLGTVNHLATSDASPAQMARVAAEAARG